MFLSSNNTTCSCSRMDWGLDPKRAVWHSSPCTKSKKYGHVTAVLVEFDISSMAFLHSATSLKSHCSDNEQSHRDKRPGGKEQCRAMSVQRSLWSISNDSQMADLFLASSLERANKPEASDDKAAAYKFNER